MSGGEEFIKRWAFTPSQFIAQPAANSINIFTAMFMHAGLAHLVGNMLYLWIFGDNVEDRLGKIPFLIFYLVCGIVSTFAQLIMDPHSSVPNLGASGAIAGVLGAYILFFPSGKVNVLLGRQITQVSALIVIGLWFVIQFISEIGSLANTEGGGGVAYMAHIGGFIAGLVIAYLYRSTTSSQT